MNTQYYKVMPIDVLPEESGHYLTDNGWKYIAIRFKNTGYKYWIKPITLTLHELLQTKEGKDIIREVFNAAREPYFNDDFRVWEYPIADDFINNTK
jgi:hypothetical protein